MKVFELNIDGLVGPTHNYAGLGIGNIASLKHAKNISNPKEAALQGLKKMRFLYNLGLKQAVLPPHQRPNLNLLSNLGFHGTPSQQLENAYKSNPKFLTACYSASSMWTANAATVSSSSDSFDNLVHFTAANLISSIHRFHEADFSQKLLQKIFSHPEYFKHHQVLAKTAAFSDEGAANHNRICEHHSKSGINIFVYGKIFFNEQSHNITSTNHFPARQTFEACAAVARNHNLNPDTTVFVAQNPRAIDLGVFHNDVISVANEYLLLVHEKAFSNQKDILQKLNNLADFNLKIIEVKEEELSLEQAVSSYLFNSQLLTLPNQEMLLLAPSECQNMPNINALISSWINDKNIPITKVEYFNLLQSMQNGGGPACLRLRVPLRNDELNAMHQGILVNNELLDILEAWVKRHYRSELHPKDLLDSALVNESFTALDELSSILKLGNIYPFQID